MFKRIIEPAEALTFEFEGETIHACEGDTVAAALLAHGVRALRMAVVSGEPRAPYCMIGVCFECLVEIDGRTNRQACITQARPGMRIRRQAQPQFEAAPASVDIRGGK